MAIIAKINALLNKYEKTSSLLFFSIGFGWDWFTIGKIDSISELFFLVAYFILLSLSVYFSFTYNTFDLLRKYEHYLEKYLPVATQFFLGGLTSSFVVFFSRSVSISRTATFLIIITFFFIVNEFFKKRMTLGLKFVHISFVSFIFFGCIFPVLFSSIDPLVFYAAGLVSLVLILVILMLITLRVEKGEKKHFSKMTYFIILTHVFIVLFFIFKLIPPVPLALEKGLVAYHIKKMDDKYEITYKPTKWYNFWKHHENELKYKTEDSVFVFTSIYSPHDLKTKVFHEWSYYDDKLEDWQLTDKIGYTIVGGRNKGYRGYSYKTHIKNGDWKVEVVTEDDIIIGILNFSIIIHEDENPKKLKTKFF